MGGGGEAHSDLRQLLEITKNALPPLLLCRMQMMKCMTYFTFPCWSQS